MIGDINKVGRIPELRDRLLFTLLMLAVYRLGVFVPVPGIDVEALRRMFDTGDGTLFGLVNMFSGGSLENFSIFTLGIMPYISVSIIIQFMTPLIPTLAALKKEGPSGQRIITRYTRQFTMLLALFQGFMIARGLASQPGLVLGQGGWHFYLVTMITLAAGTAFIMWLGEQITEKGLGNGMSMVIFAGIIARMPQELAQLFVLSSTGEIQPLAMLMILVFCIATVAAIVYVERSFRKIPVQYPRHNVGKNIQAPPQHLPLKVNMAGVIPPIFASAFFALPATVASFSTNESLQEFMNYLMPGTWTYTATFVVLIIVFSYYYTSVVYNPVEVADNLKKNGAFIPSVRPGAQTAEYLYGVLNRLTFWGAIYIALVCLIPQWAYMELGAGSFAYVFGGTAVLIVVGVTLDTASQIQSLVVARNYEAFMSKSTKIRGLGGVTMRTRVLKR